MMEKRRYKFFDNGCEGNFKTREPKSASESKRLFFRTNWVGYFFQIVTDLRDSLHQSGGIGLAAPQIDIPFRILVIEIINTLN